MIEEGTARTQLVAASAALYGRLLTHGRTGNLSVRCQAGILVTPSGVSLGELDEDHLALVDDRGRQLSGPKASKETFLHAAMLRSRPRAGAVIHTHSTHAAAVSCLADVDPDDVFPPLTAYHVMRVGRVPLLPYHAPGDTSLEPLVEQIAKERSAVLLSNHGPVVTGADLGAAVEALEELEETAKIFLLLRDMPTRPLTTEQCRALPTPTT